MSVATPALEATSRQYSAEGFAGPFRVMTPEQAAAGRSEFFSTIGLREGDPERPDGDLFGFYHRYRWAYELATAPAILDHLEAILGPDLVLWAMLFHYKPPHSETAIPWHQDGTHWPMEPVVNCSAWVTLGESFPDNGGLRIAAGSHRDWVGYDVRGAEPRLQTIAVPEADVDPDRIVDLTMKPGEAVFFSATTVHSSGPNVTDVPRVAFVLRFTTPEVKLDEAKIRKSSPHVRTMLLRGEDRFNLNPGLRGSAPA